MKIRPAVIATRPNREGRYYLKIAIAHKSKTAHINTPFSILPSEWENGIVVKNRNAARINRFLAVFLDRCMEAAYELPFVDMSVEQIRAAVTEKVKPLIGQIMNETSTIEMENAMDKKSNRISYIENRAAYYEKVVQMFAAGMTAKEIIKSVPVGKSTIYRWFDEYRAENEEANLRMSPKLAMQTIAELNGRVRALESQLDGKNKSDAKYQLALSALSELDSEVCAIRTKIKSLIAELKKK